MVHGALVFHRKCQGKRLGHQMYMVVFVEECSMGMWVHCTQCWCLQSLEWDTGWNSGVENGMERRVELTHVTGTVQGCAS